MINSALRTLLGVVLLSTPSSAQISLPGDMNPSFAQYRNYAERMRISKPGDSDYVVVDMSYESDTEQVVSLKWRAQASGATSVSVTTTEEVSFQPTAVARRAGSDNVFYVVGWWSGPAKVIVEKWVVQPFAVGQLILPSGIVTTTMTKPRIRRSLVWTSDATQVSPIWDAAVLPYSNDLWMLESGPVTRIYSLDLQTATAILAYTADSTGFEELSGHRCFAVGLHPAAGFVVMTSQRKPWTSGYNLNPTTPMFVNVDSDLDGIIDSTFFDDVGEYKQLYPSPWDMTYVVP